MTNGIPPTDDIRRHIIPGRRECRSWSFDDFIRERTNRRQWRDIAVRLPEQLAARALQWGEQSMRALAVFSDMGTEGIEWVNSFHPGTRWEMHVEYDLRTRVTSAVLTAYEPDTMQTFAPSVAPVGEVSSRRAASSSRLTLELSGFRSRSSSFFGPAPAPGRGFGFTTLFGMSVPVEVGRSLMANANHDGIPPTGLGLLLQLYQQLASERPGAAPAIMARLWQQVGDREYLGISYRGSRESNRLEVTVRGADTYQDLIDAAHPYQMYLLTHIEEEPPRREISDVQMLRELRELRRARAEPEPLAVPSETWEPKPQLHRRLNLSRKSEDQQDVAHQPSKEHENSISQRLASRRRRTPGPRDQH